MWVRLERPLCFLSVLCIWMFWCGQRPCCSNIQSGLVFFLTQLHTVTWLKGTFTISFSSGRLRLLPVTICVAKDPKKADRESLEKVSRTRKEEVFARAIVARPCMCAATFLFHVLDMTELMERWKLFSISHLRGRRIILFRVTCTFTSVRVTGITLRHVLLRRSILFMWC